MAPAATPSVPRLLTLWRWSASLALLVLFSYLGWVLATVNFRTVLPGQAYRCGQLSADRLEQVVRRHGIRTVINLRGCCVNLPWYREEAAATARLDIAQEDIGFSARRMPPTLALRQLIDILDRSEYPILFHCHQGADRTGLAAVLVLLLRSDASLATARRQLGLATMHLAIGKTGNIDHFFDLYEAWLASRQVEHTPELFRTWAREHYCPGEGRAEITLIEPDGRRSGTRASLRVAANTTRLVRVRCRNRSDQPWQFQPGNNAGIHARAQLIDHHHHVIRHDQVGRFLARVAPGETIDLELPLPALARGRYELRVDLVDEQHASFLQLGSEPLVIHLEAT